MRKNHRRCRLLTASTVLVAGCVMLFPDGAVAQPATDSAPAQISGTFQLINAQTGKCATVAGGVSTDNNVRLVQFNCDSHPSRRWIVTNSNGRSNQVVNEQTRKCATVAGGVSTDNNVELVQFNCDTHPSRRWIITNQSGNSFQLVNAQTGKCMTVAGGVSTDNNVALVQFTCDTHPSRRWILRRVGGNID
ncbi:RICIN domain-containing protein [Streptomyces endophytica]|uniref:RICIN domain-containing protein n=1 Tax=Streptomyces endophytica TaxID=2991496 RepID=A0ABY6P7Z8_9ACTN|nr:RICIN domain-containing protein [Streptomyces endophytica]UZJ29347.1 RICIN domain-containing protein [Streptomyces endophytica]